MKAKTKKGNARRAASAPSSQRRRPRKSRSSRRSSKRQFNEILTSFTREDRGQAAEGRFIPALGGDSGRKCRVPSPSPSTTAKARANIQGNTIPGFNKDHQHFLFFRLGDVAPAKDGCAGSRR